MVRREKERGKGDHRQGYVAVHTADALQSGSGSGILQNRYPFERSAWAGIYNSTAMNADTVFAIWRACFERYAHWLNTFERGGHIRPVTPGVALDDG